MAKKSLNDADSFDDCQLSSSKLENRQRCQEPFKNRPLIVLIISINAQSRSEDATPPPLVGGGDHSCPYGRKLIGSLVPVHS